MSQVSLAPTQFSHEGKQQLGARLCRALPLEALSFETSQGGEDRLGQVVPTGILQTPAPLTVSYATNSSQRMLNT